MYPAKYFVTNHDESDKVKKLINDNPLATLLVMLDESFPHISHIPFHFAQCDNSIAVETRELIAHVSNHHPLAKKLLCQKEVSLNLVFHGEQGYISPHCQNKSELEEHYQNKANGQVVPTWNYAKVHVTGIATPVIDPESKYQQMKKSTQHFEHEQAIPWKITEVSDKKIHQMLTAITFFKVSITTIEGHFKLSQNKPEDVKIGIAKQLRQKGKEKLAEQIQG